MTRLELLKNVLALLSMAACFVAMLLFGHAFNL